MNRVEESQKYTLKEVVKFPTKSGPCHFLHQEYALVFADKYIVCEYNVPLYWTTQEEAEIKKAQMHSVLSSPEFVKIVYIEDSFVRMT